MSRTNPFSYSCGLMCLSFYSVVDLRSAVTFSFCPVHCVFFFFFLNFSFKNTDLCFRGSIFGFFLFFLFIYYFIYLFSQKVCFCLRGNYFGVFTYFGEGHVGFYCVLIGSFHGLILFRVQGFF